MPSASSSISAPVAHRRSSRALAVGTDSQRENDAARADPAMADKRRTFSLVFIASAVLFIAVGAGMAWWQGHRIATHVAVPATIVSASAERRGSSEGGPTYAPVVTFRYQVAG